MQARERLAGLTPQPYAPDRAALADRARPAISPARPTTACFGCLTVSTIARAMLSTAVDCQAQGHDRQLRHAPARQRRCGSRARPSRSARTAGSPRACSRAKAARASGVVKAVTGRGEPLGDAQFTVGDGASEATAKFDLPLEIRNQVARSRSPASALPARCSCSTPARNGIVSASSRANRARPRSRCCRRSIMCSARSRPMPRSSRRPRAMSPTRCMS